MKPLLGCNLDKLIAGESIEKELEVLFQTNRVYLSVGAIEPRKNHKYLLDAFDLVWKECPETVLCIVGKKRGWLNDAIMKRIKTHPLFKKNLFLLNSVSDNALAYCYNHSKALIFPSLLEGFGLPIVEALHYGLPVFASNIPIHKEVGKEFCAYFDLDNPANLSQIIINIEKTGEMPRVKDGKGYTLLSWKDSCRDLFSQVRALTGF